MNAAGNDIVVLLVIVGLRLVVPLFIPRFPLPAIVACLVIDAADQSIFQQFTDLDLDGYQGYDKSLDIYYLTVAYLAILRNWRNGFAIEVARFLWYYRLVGVLLFEIIGARAILFIFPNTFEYYFIAFEAIRLGWDPRRLSRKAVIGITAFIWIFIKLPQEWWIHIAQLDFTDFVKEDLFGVESTTSWGDTFSNRPWVLVAIIAALVAIGLVARHYWKRRPPQDWPIGVDADRPMPPAEVPGLQLAEPPLRWPLVEKVALISLITGIFSLVLGVDARGWQILLAAVIVVATNAAISAWLAGRGTEWRSIGLEFVVLTVLNAVLLGVAAQIIGDGLNRGLSLFFGYLLTMIIVLYDRFRDRHFERMAEMTATAPA